MSLGIYVYIHNRGTFEIRINHEDFLVDIVDYFDVTTKYDTIKKNIIVVYVKMDTVES